MIIQKANNSDAGVLSEITKRSKAYWGYSDEQLEAWSELLTITEAYLESNSVYKLIADDKTIGYYSFFYEDKQTTKLDNLFVLPEYIGTGIGRLLMEDFLKHAKSTAATRILLDADPYAESFYAKFGFIKTGQIATSVKDRFLPVMMLQIATE